MKKNRYVLWLMLAVLAAAALNQQFGSAGSAPADAPAAGSRFYALTDTKPRQINTPEDIKLRSGLEIPQLLLPDDEV